MANHSGAGFSARPYRKLSTEELQNKLRCMTFAEGELDMEQTDGILSELKYRNANAPAQTAEDAWLEFQAVYADLEPDYIACEFAAPIPQWRIARRLGHEPWRLVTTIPADVPDTDMPMAHADAPEHTGVVWPPEYSDCLIAGSLNEAKELRMLEHIPE